MGIASGISHFFAAIVETLQGIVAAILSVLQAAVQLVVDTGKGLVNFIEGTLGFAIHNFFLLGTVAAAVLAYVVYTQRQGTAPISRSVKNK